LYDAPLRELPVLTKAMVMEHFDDLVTDRTIRLEDVKAQMKDDEHSKDRCWQGSPDHVHAASLCGRTSRHI
jgi:hypothetical protein